jgi:hypothetical protein
MLASLHYVLLRFKFQVKGLEFSSAALVFHEGFSSSYGAAARRMSLDLRYHAPPPVHYGLMMSFNLVCLGCVPQAFEYIHDISGQRRYQPVRYRRGCSRYYSLSDSSAFIHYCRIDVRHIVEVRKIVFACMWDGNYNSQTRVNG